MAHFAQIDGNNIVAQVIVADQDVINTGMFGDPALWIQTSYNTHGGVHTQGGTPLRKNYAGIGYTYDEAKDAFIPPKNFKSKPPISVTFPSKVISPVIAILYFIFLLLNKL